MKKIGLQLLAFCLCIRLTGCQNQVPVSNVIEITPDGRSCLLSEQDPALLEAMQLCNRLLYGIQHQDSSVYEELFEPQFVKELDENGFKESCRKVEKEFGKITGYSYLCSLKFPMMQNLVWRVDFQNEDQKGNTSEYQLLFQVILGKIDGKYKILGMGFL